MKCANCRTEDSPAYTLRAHVDGDEMAAQGDGNGSERTVDLQFCSFECLSTWT